MSRLLIVLCVLGALTGCGKRGGPPPVESSLPREVVSGVPRGLLELAEVLPDGIEAFGYLELGELLREPPTALGGFHTLYGDVMDMVKRRWGVDPRELSGLGFVALDGQIVLVGDARAFAAPAPASGLAITRVGKLSAVGSPSAIGALAAAFDKSPRLAAAQLGWLKAALQRSVGQRLLITAPGGALERLGASPQGVAELSSVTLSAGRDGARLSLQAKPGRGGALRSQVEGALTSVKATLPLVVGQLAAAPPDGPEALGAVLLRHWGKALLASVELQAQGEDLAIWLPWHAPTMPAVARAPDLDKRAIAPGEWNVFQLDLGVPVLEYLVAAGDVLAAPIDRAAAHREVVDAFAAWMTIPGFDPTRLVVSTGSHIAFSLHSSIKPAAAPPRRLADSPMVLAPESWGLTFWMIPNPELPKAGQPLPSGKPLARLATSAAAKGPAVLRWILDTTNWPKAATFFGPLPIRAVEAAVRESRVEVSLVASAGQSPVLQAALREIAAAALQAATADYRLRSQGAVDDELLAILQYHLFTFTQKVVSSARAKGDQLVLEAPLTSLQLAILAAGALGQIAVPAFKDYMRKSKSSEAELQLAKIRTNAKAYFAENGEYPTLSAPLTPARSCCTYPDNKCPATAADWAHPHWQALDFALDEPHAFRYELTSTQTSYTARAVGDLDCDGVEIEYTLVGGIANGNPTTSLTKPAPNVD